jgi:lipopolysaccharide/colanic/teichoic acid biosynthesis glycosyltransferase
VTFRSAGPTGLAVADPTSPRFYESTKRLIDLVCCGVALAGLAPILGVIALLIRLDSAGPILFRQERVGEGGRRFTMLKFRSMTASADTSPHQEFVTAYIRGEELGGKPTAATSDAKLYKLVADKRVTRVGKWLRKTSLDELPQLWNVVRGDMSLVGPRPPLPYEVDLYEPWQLGRLDVRPGISGVWQVSGRNTTTFNEMVEMDLDYIRKRSLKLDLSILLKTIPVVLFARDAC